MAVKDFGETPECLRRQTRFATVRKWRVKDASKKFDEHLRGVAYRNGRGAALFVAAFVTALAVHLAMRTRFGPRYATVLLGLGGAIIMGAVGWGFGEIGGPERPWIHLAYPALFFSVLAPVR